jgi:hypothetical protein
MKSSLDPWGVPQAFHVFESLFLKNIQIKLKTFNTLTPGECPRDFIFKVIKVSKAPKDFKIKFKTEMCKFWELDAVCKYGDNVIIKK